MKIYQKRKRLNVAVNLTAVSSIMIGGIMTRLFYNDDLSDYSKYLPLVIFVLLLPRQLSTVFCPLYEIEDGQLIKYDLFIKSKSINIDKIESSEKVFGDIHVKEKNKKIVIDKNIIDQDDWKKLLNELETRTSSKLA